MKEDSQAKIYMRCLQDQNRNMNNKHCLYLLTTAIKAATSQEFIDTQTSIRLYFQ